MKEDQLLTLAICTLLSRCDEFRDIDDSIISTATAIALKARVAARTIAKNVLTEGN